MGYCLSVPELLLGILLLFAGGMLIRLEGGLLEGLDGSSPVDSILSTRTPATDEEFGPVGLAGALPAVFVQITWDALSRRSQRHGCSQ